jgi:hypothetical protein
LHNTFAYNVAVCPSRGACAGGSALNSLGDAAQQTGFWALSATNDFIYNRMANHHNGLFFNFENGEFKAGQGLAQGKLCTEYAELGVFKGNVNHSNQRFGLYFDNFWPRKLNRDVASNGMVRDIANCNSGWCSCLPLTADGDDNGASGVVEDSLEYGNDLVGQYFLGDVQYKGLHAINNNGAGIYWKWTKPFADGRKGHIVGSKFEWIGSDDDAEISSILGSNSGGAFVSALLPGGLGTNHIINTSFTGPMGVYLGLNNQCPGNGALCTAETDLTNVTAGDGARQYVMLGVNGNSELPILTSSDGSLGVTSLASRAQSHLLGLSGCSPADVRYDSGIACSTPLRRLQVWGNSQGSLTLTPISYTGTPYQMNWMGSGNLIVSGYGANVAVGETYKLSGFSIPNEIAIEFSDPTYADESLTLVLESNGQEVTCTLSSQDSRKYITQYGPIFSGPMNTGNVQPGSCTAELQQLNRRLLKSGTKFV